MREVLAKAAYAPSNSNIQPWQVRVVAGAAMARLKALMAARSTDKPQFDDLQFKIYPDNLQEPYATRRFDCGERQYSKVGLAREDGVGRLRYVYRNMQFFNAPAGMFTFCEGNMEPSQWADLGCFIQTVMLLLKEAGLDSCAQISWCRFNKAVSEFVGAPPGWTLYCGMSIGYRDPTAPVNSIVPDRAPLDAFAQFIVD